ncbi:hypothetical protein EV195_108125 [Tenacibaculum skagerrakense]|uniref:Uncharacterized protein n=1 Tax=Tenacibaculum skagerrakense TaxID=186571 RepID=A0A4R2NQQ6_9FLAO|nr:hypothetical protein EV195_108125 [Tenacibaculum skagerrakense]
MKLNSKNIGRILIFKYLGITVLILLVLIIIFTSLSIELKKYINQNLVNSYLKESTYFNIQIVLNLIIVFFISGDIGKSILEKNKDSFWTTFFGFLKMWVGFLMITMFAEMIPRIIEYGIDFESVGLGVLIWIVMGGPIFLIIGSIQGGITSWFVGKEMEYKKTHYNNV